MISKVWIIRYISSEMEGKTKFEEEKKRERKARVKGERGRKRECKCTKEEIKGKRVHCRCLECRGISKKKTAL